MLPHKLFVVAPTHLAHSGNVLYLGLEQTELLLRAQSTLIAVPLKRAHCPLCTFCLSMFCRRE